MGVEDFSKFKKNRKKRSQLAHKKWRESQYDPKLFRKKPGNLNATPNHPSTSQMIKLSIYALVVVMVLIAAYVLFKNKGFFD
jgi:hypothetical protein